MISMKLKSYLYRAVSLPPHLIVTKTLNRTKNRLRLIHRRRWDQKNLTYGKPLNCPFEELQHYFQPLPIGSLSLQSQKIRALAASTLSHRFDLLGSGWVRVRYDMDTGGLNGQQYKMGFPVQAEGKGHWLEGRINRSNIGEARRIWSSVDHDYIPIDWHLDFKSGYRWAEDIWYHDILRAQAGGGYQGTMGIGTDAAFALISLGLCLVKGWTRRVCSTISLWSGNFAIRYLILSQPIPLGLV